MAKKRKDGKVYFIFVILELFTVKPFTLSYRNYNGVVSVYLQICILNNRIKRVYFTLKR